MNTLPQQWDAQADVVSIGSADSLASPSLLAALATVPRQSFRRLLRGR